MPNGTCTVPSCEKPSRSQSPTSMCKMHYHRWYRHGSTDKVATRKSTRTDASSYRSISRPDHPLAMTSGRIYEHRMVLFDEVGEGSHPCHWCSRIVTWMLPVGHPDNLQVDHLNGVRNDNRLENLVVSCPNCNVRRGMQTRSRRLRDEGWWAKNDTIANLRNGGRMRVVDPAA
jgi:5-methylcytosine-specific restriction endonuclease McrA